MEYSLFTCDASGNDFVDDQIWDTSNMITDAGAGDPGVTLQFSDF